MFYNERAIFFDNWQTSGSTGEPLKFRVPRYLKLIDRMIFLRMMSNRNFHMTARSSLIMLSSYSPGEGEPLYKKFGPFKNVWRVSPFHINEKTLEQYVQIIVQSKAEVLSGYPSSIYLFTLQLMKRGIKIPSIKVIKTASEMLLPAYRDVIMNWWKLPVLDWYGQAEMTALVIQCNYGNYHNQDDYGFCEISERGELILTSLNNDVMPFIRYNSGDFAEPINEQQGCLSCPCGRQFSIPFKQVLGRSDDLLSKQDGTRIPVVNFCTFLSKVSNVDQFKIIQYADYSIDILIVSPSNFNQHELIIAGIRDRIGNLPIKVVQVDKIPRNPKTMKQKTIETFVQ